MTDHFRVLKMNPNASNGLYEVSDAYGRQIRADLSRESADRWCRCLNEGFAAGVEHERREQRERTRA